MCCAVCEWRARARARAPVCVCVYAIHGELYVYLCIYCLMPVFSALFLFAASFLLFLCAPLRFQHSALFVGGVVAGCRCCSFRLLSLFSPFHFRSLLVLQLLFGRRRLLGAAGFFALPLPFHLSATYPHHTDEHCYGRMPFFFHARAPSISCCGGCLLLCVFLLLLVGHNLHCCTVSLHCYRRTHTQMHVATALNRMVFQMQSPNSICV